MKGKTGICALTLEECELRESHLYPHFIWKFLKDNGGDKFRSTNNPTEVLQDGLKCFLLGHRAEQMFSKQEKWFAETIFKPFCNGNLYRYKVKYDERLYYFIVSLIWRICYYYKDNIIDIKVKNKCIVALEEWRNYLLHGTIPPTFHYIYLMPITPDLFFSPSLQVNPDFQIPYAYYQSSKEEFYIINYYLLRAFDQEIFCDLADNCAFYCKTPRFFFWSVLERNNNQLNYGMRISPQGGKLDFKRYRIGNDDVKKYILGRIVKTNEVIERAVSKISEKAQDKIVERTLNITNLKDSELGRLLIEQSNVK